MTDKQVELEGNPDIVLSCKGREIIRLTRKGFVYRGKFVKDENECHKRFGEWLGLVETEVEVQARKDRQGSMGKDGKVTVRGEEVSLSDFDLPEAEGGAGPCLGIEATITPIDSKLAEIGAKRELMIIQASPDGDEEGIWMDLGSDHLPDWVKQPDAMGDMRRGTRIHHTDGGFWYRALLCVPAGSEVH